MQPTPSQGCGWGQCDVLPLPLCQHLPSCNPEISAPEVISCLAPHLTAITLGSERRGLCPFPSLPHRLGHPVGTLFFMEQNPQPSAWRGEPPKSRILHLGTCLMVAFLKEQPREYLFLGC